MSHPSAPLAKPVQITKVLASAGPEQISATRRIFKSASIGGFKGNNTPNDASVWIGNNATYQFWEVPPGSVIADWGEDGGLMQDWADCYIRGTSGDGIVANFIEGSE